MNEFAGWLKTYDTKHDEEREDLAVLLDVTEVKSDGTVELAFTDRNERVYLRFKMHELVQRACLAAISD